MRADGGLVVTGDVTGWLGLVVFDVDGTLASATMDIAVGRALGQERVVSDWVELYRGHRVSSRELGVRIGALLAGAPTSIRLDVPLLPGTRETVAAFVAAGLAVAVATLGPRFAAERLMSELGMIGGYGSLYGHSDGRFDGTLLYQATPRGKAAALGRLCSRLGVSKRRCIAIGDSAGDIPMFGAAGWSIAFNGDPAARRAAHTVCGGHDLRALLPIVFEEVGRWTASVRTDLYHRSPI